MTWLHPMDIQAGARMRTRRNVLGISLQELADQTNIRLAQMSRIENGLNRISAGQLYLIAQTLDVDIAYFFDDVEREDAELSATQQRRAREFKRSVDRISDPADLEAIYQFMTYFLARKR